MWTRKLSYFERELKRPKANGHSTPHLAHSELAVTVDSMIGTSGKPSTSLARSIDPLPS
jgi:hypothetical protein